MADEQGGPGPYETVLLEWPEEGVAHCVFNLPEVRNALGLAMVRDIRSVLQELASRTDLKALIFSGAGGKAFVSGADIGELRDRRKHDALQGINSRLFREIETFPAPTIAAVRGFALGGGCELALACDLRVCGEGARFGQPEVGLGIIPGAGATYRLPRVVGAAVARELILTGRIIDAAEAARIGLVNHVVPDEEVLTRALALAGEIGRNSVLAVRCAKQALLQADGGGVDSGMALESMAQAVLFEDDEKMARMTAFLERKKRPRSGG